MGHYEKEQALHVLTNASWLKSYPQALAECLVTEGHFIHLDSGEWAQAEGDDQSGLFIVINGAFHSYCAAPGDRTVLMGLAEAGTVLGHATRFSGGPRLVTAVCIEPSTLLILTEAALDRVAEQQPKIWQAMADFAYANMRNALRMAAESIALRPRQRIASRLLAAAENHVDRAKNQQLIVRLSQESLSEIIGVTRKTVNGHLATFERDGLIKTGYGHIIICDTERLRDVTNS